MLLFYRSCYWRASSRGFREAPSGATVADRATRGSYVPMPGSTVRGYERTIRSYIAPTLGKVPLARLRTAQLDGIYAQLREKGGQNGTPLAPATVRQAHAILRRAPHQGIRRGWISGSTRRAVGERDPVSRP